MDKYVTLIGTEQVQSAASTMRHAAEEMSRAAGWIDESMRQQRVFMDEWLTRFEQVLNAAIDSRNVKP